MAELVSDKCNYGVEKMELNTDSCKQPKVNIVGPSMAIDRWVQDNVCNVNCINVVPYEVQPAIANCKCDRAFHNNIKVKF